MASTKDLNGTVAPDSTMHFAAMYGEAKGYGVYLAGATHNPMV